MKSFYSSIKSQIIINKSVLRIFCGKCGWVLIQLWMVETCLKCSYSGLSVTTMFEIDFLILFSSKKNFAQFFVSSIEWKLVRYTYNLFRFCSNMFISYKYFESTVTHKFFRPKFKCACVCYNVSNTNAMMNSNSQLFQRHARKYLIAFISAGPRATTKLDQSTLVLNPIYNFYCSAAVRLTIGHR